MAAVITCERTNEEEPMTGYLTQQAQETRIQDLRRSAAAQRRASILRRRRSRR
jgi:hypothetical protein